MATESPCWFKSSYSNTGGACVEVATNLVAASGTVPVRDSKNLTGPVLDVSAPAFALFVTDLKAGGLDAV
ncbi:DUF397 domain-containing protein [Streptomyces sp. NPDC046203]|uniref:DUF397 domain-containing protein n=1 Tax=Streptomyces sp. NPDC046203 TaxID=3154602 RepID=UPI00340B770D